MRHEHKSSLATAFSRKGNVFEPKYACNSLLLAFREELPRGSGCHHVFPRLEHDHSDRAAGAPEASSSATSPDSPERPARPDSCSSVRSSASSVRWCLSRYKTAPGSTDPGRVAIGTPSSGVKPIVVSTEWPSRTAVTEQPPPRWQTMRRGTRSRSLA